LTSLVEKIVSLHASLQAAGIDHAFGGALALAYCTGEPRATADVDLNVFVSPRDAETVFAAMPRPVTVGAAAVTEAADRGQVRLWWDETPVDVFFGYHQFHKAVGGRTRLVSFADSEIPVLDCSDLTVFKAIFGRPRDWVDIEAMAEAGLDLSDALSRLESVVDRASAAYRQLSAIGRKPDETEPYRRAFGRPPTAHD
jgi:hypothetical protein